MSSTSVPPSPSSSPQGVVEMAHAAKDHEPGDSIHRIETEQSPQSLEAQSIHLAGQTSHLEIPAEARSASEHTSSPNPAPSLPVTELIFESTSTPATPTARTPEQPILAEDRQRHTLEPSPPRRSSQTDPPISPRFLDSDARGHRNPPFTESPESISVVLPCATEGHAYTTKYGTWGIVAAVLGFPYGMVCLL
jgi:hypothetical protein